MIPTSHARSKLFLLLLSTAGVMLSSMFSPMFSLRLAHAQTMDVQLEDDLFSVEAENASLIEIGSRLSELSDIAINFTEGADQQITITLVKEDLTSVVSKLAENNVITTRKIDGKDVITEVLFLLPEGDSNFSNANLPSGAPADEVYVEPEQVAESDEIYNAPTNSDPNSSGNDPNGLQGEPGSSSEEYDPSVDGGVKATDQQSQ